MEMLTSELHKLKVIQHKNLCNTLEELCCCQENAPSCLLGTCKECMEKKVLYLPFDADSPAVLKKWEMHNETYTDHNGVLKKTTKPQKTEAFTTIGGLVDEMEKTLPSFKTHVGRIFHQYQAIKELKENLPKTSILIHIDFSENYSCKYTEEVQAVHFAGAHQQITLHTGMLCFNTFDNLGCNMKKPFCTISSSLRYDASAIWAHLKPILSWSTGLLKEPVTTVHFLSDGSSSQYRNKAMFYLMLHHIEDLLPSVQKLTWNYSEAGHGKGAPDGIGGVLKRTADNLVAQGTDVHNIEQFYAALKESCKGVELFQLKRDDIDQVDVTLRSKALSTVPGTNRVHQVMVDVINKRQKFRALTCWKCEFNTKCSEDIGSVTISKKENSKISTPPFKVGDWVAVTYDDILYHGEVLEVTPDGIQVNCMEKSMSNKFKWPKKADICTYMYENLKFKICEPVPCDNRALYYTFPNNNFD